MAVLDLSNAAPDYLSFDTIFNFKGSYKIRTATSVTVKSKAGTFSGKADPDLTFIWFNNPVLGPQALAGAMEKMVYKSASGKVLASISDAVAYLPAYDGLLKTDPKNAGMLYAAAVFAFEDTILGSDGKDKLFGFTGNDRLFGDKGADVLNGGTEIDTAYYTAAVTVDMQNASKGTGQAKGDTFKSIEIIEGSSQKDTLRGDAGDNTLRGMDGDDVLEGRAGNDTLEGGAGKDVLKGGSGTNTLWGGTGQDDLYGDAAGTDTFVFKALAETGTTAATADRIFNLGAGDVIDVTAIDAIEGGGTGNDAFTYTAGGTLTGAGQVVSAMDGNDTILFFSTDADADAEMVIRLVNVNYNTTDLTPFLAL